MYAEPMLKAANAASGVPIPPPAPTRNAGEKLYCACTSSRRAIMVGNKVKNGRLSVWPPESASAVISSAIGTSFDSSACSGVILPCTNNLSINFCGAGSIKRRPTSVRDTLAITLLPI